MIVPPQHLLWDRWERLSVDGSTDEDASGLCSSCWEAASRTSSAWGAWGTSVLSCCKCALPGKNSQCVNCEWKQSKAQQRKAEYKGRLSVVWLSALRGFHSFVHHFLLAIAVSMVISSKRRQSNAQTYSSPNFIWQRKWRQAVKLWATVLTVAVLPCFCAVGFISHISVWFTSGLKNPDQHLAYCY